MIKRHFCVTPGAESKVWNMHMYFSLPINPHLPTEHLAIFLFSYLACVAATALSMIFTAAINGRFHRDILYHFCDHQLTPVHFWDIITSALWTKVSEQQVRESCNKQTRWDTQEIRLHLWGIPHLIQIPVRTELSLSLLVMYLPEKLMNIILKHNSVNFVL